MRFQGWIFDLYPSPQGMKLWLMEPNQKRHLLIDRFTPSFYVSGSSDGLRRIQESLASKSYAVTCGLTERTDIWEREARTVLEVSVQHPNEYSSWSRWVHRFDSSLRLYNNDLMLASVYCWSRNIFPMAFVEAEVDDENRVQALGCRDNEWEMDYELPPIEIMRVRLGGLSRIDPAHGRQTALEVEVGGREYELDESGEPAAVAFQHLLKRHDPDLILSDWGDATILPRLLQQAAHLNITLPFNRDPGAQVQQSKARSFMSYGRILFKNSATTLFGRLHVDTQNAFMTGNGDLSGLWELVRVTKLPVQYASRTTPGTGISYMQMGLAYRDGVLIPEQKAEPEDPKSPDQVLIADRGGLVFTPKLGFFTNVAELDFVSEYATIMDRYNISPETVNCKCCPDAKKIPELGYHACKRRRGITSSIVEKLITKRAALKKCVRTAPPAQMQHYKLQREALKWLLVCCFGYTGYKNARFGKIEAHEAINAVARETLLIAKETAESHGYEVLHALVDSIYVHKHGAVREDYDQLALEIGEMTRLPLAVEEIYRYAVFLPSRRFEDIPVPNRFFAVSEDGELKVRGLESRRHDMPPMIIRMQKQVLAILAEAHDYDSYRQKLLEARATLCGYEERLDSGDVAIEDLVVSKRLTHAPRDYQKANLTAVVAQQLYGGGVKLRPGQTVQYVITDADASVPNDRVKAFALWNGWYGYDREKYKAMLREAFEPFTKPCNGGVNIRILLASKNEIARTGALQPPRHLRHSQSLSMK